MYRNLPRHTFGYIQGKLFPKYFLVGMILSSITMTTFIIQNPLHSWKSAQIVQVRLYILCAALGFMAILHTLFISQNTNLMATCQHLCMPFSQCLST